MNFGLSLRWVRLQAGIAVLVAAGIQAASAAEWRGLVIGIDAYQHVSPLNGAVNDASDISATLRAAGVQDLTTLYDADASRTAILSAWQALVSRSAPDDVLVLSYAGHGAQEKEWTAGSETDGLDEVFLLAGFDVSAPANGERLRDDDLAMMIRAAGTRRVLILADSCHSGTMTRSVDPRVNRLGTRIVGLPPIENDVLRAANHSSPVAQMSAQDTLDAQELENVVYIGATVDGQVIPELMISGEPRGALSWAFARGVEGRADLDGDGGITMDELALFLNETVRVATEGRQNPSLTIGDRSRSAVLPKAQSVFFDPGKTVLTISGNTPESGPVLEQIARRHGERAEAADYASADLLWDVKSGDVLTRLGDVALRKEATNADRFAGVVAKWIFLSELYKTARDIEPIEGAIQPSVGHIPNGSPFQVGLTSQRSGYMAVFGLEADGTLRLLAPDRSADPLGIDTKIATDQPYGLHLQAAPPFGADHIVLIRSDSDMARLVGVLSAVDGQTLDPVVSDQVLKLIRKSASAVGIVGIYTQPD